jgi:hypothetical protein
VLDYREKDNDKIPCPVCKNGPIAPCNDFAESIQLEGFYTCLNPGCKLNQVPIFILPVIVKN